MKFLFASDSFKGTLSSRRTAELLTQAAGEVFPGCGCGFVEMADGGEGTVDAVLSAAGGHKRTINVHNPLGRIIRASYGVLPDKTAVIEMAAASGLTLVPPGLRDPRRTTSFGTGELIADALAEGCRKIAVAIGGSATNDGGTGCMQALGVRFLDENGLELPGLCTAETADSGTELCPDKAAGSGPELCPDKAAGSPGFCTGADLAQIRSIDLTGINPLIRDTEFTIMCDVTNPLCGENGATYTFGKQKGGTPEILNELESGMQNYRDLLLRHSGVNPDEVPGAGAAGGLGAALTVFLNGKMKSGIETVLDLTGFDEKLADVDLVITGEGRADGQSVCGKVMQGVGLRCRKYGIPAVAIVGSMGAGAEALFDCGIESIITTVNGIMPLEEALERAEELYLGAARRMFRMLRAGQPAFAGMKKSG